METVLVFPQDAHREAGETARYGSSHAGHEGIEGVSTRAVNASKQHGTELGGQGRRPGGNGIYAEIQMMSGGWLGHKEATRENILEKGGNRKRPEESVWLEPEHELSAHGSCMAFLDSVFYPNPRAEPSKDLNEKSKMNYSSCWRSDG